MYAEICASMPSCFLSGLNKDANVQNYMLAKPSMYIEKLIVCFWVDAVSSVEKEIPLPV